MADAQPFTPKQPFSPEGGAERLASVTKLPTLDHGHPLETGGVSLPDYEAEVGRIDTERYPELDCRYGRFWLRHVVMTDGVHYEQLVGIPSERSTGTAALLTPAWFTSHKAGHNAEIARDALKVGLVPIVHGAATRGSQPLSRSAHDMTKAFQDTDGFDEYETDHFALFGDSRGAMIGFGTAAYARELGIQVTGGQLVDPCIAKPISARDLRDLPRYVEHVHEVQSLARQIGRLTLAQLPHYARTLSPNPSWILQQLRVGVPLFSGEAGDMGRALAAGDTPRLDVLTFTRSAANHREVWEEIFDGTNVTITPRTGTHLSIANPRTRATRQQAMGDIARNQA